MKVNKNLIFPILPHCEISLNNFVKPILFSLILSHAFWQKFREINGFTKDVTKELISRNIFWWERISCFSHWAVHMEDQTKNLLSPKNISPHCGSAKSVHKTITWKYFVKIIRSIFLPTKITCKSSNRNSLSPKNISWNQIFSNFFSKNAVFTKFLSKFA